MEKFRRLHTIKIDRQYYDNIVSGRKRFEIRYDDRDYQVGDLLCLVCAGDPNENIFVEIIYKTTYEQKDGWCVLGIRPKVHGPEVSGE
jgi:hypothetical protein